MKNISIYIVLLILFVSFSFAEDIDSNSENDDISDHIFSGIDITKTTLYFYRDRNTVSRKNQTKKQLNCIGGSANCTIIPYVIACYNHGFDGYDYHWECKTELPSNVTLGEVSISCESFNKENDGIVLQGSCSIDFYLNIRRYLRNSNSHLSIFQRLVQMHFLVLIVVISGLFVIGLRRTFLLLWFILLLPYHLIMSLYIHLFYPTYSYPFFADKPNSNPFVLEYFNNQGHKTSAFAIILNWGLLGLLFNALNTSDMTKQKVDSSL